MGKLCLSMLVLNDSARLAASLSSFADVVDAYVVVDLGSEDGSADIVRSVFEARGVPGFVIDVPFKSFAQARNRAMDAARESDLEFEWFLMAEPGQVLVVDDPFFRAGLWSDCHSVSNRTAVSFATRCIVRRSASARFRGVTHEALEASGNAPTVPGISVVTVDPGDLIARARRDIAMLNRGIRVEPDAMMRARYTFYLGSDHRLVGNFRSARRCYLERAKLGFWAEEVYCARLYAARCGEALGLPATDMIQEYAALNNDMMHRAEALHAIARICRANGWWEQAFITAEAAAGIQKPADALFLEDWIYDWGAADEVAVAAFWTGRTDLCIELCDQLLASGWLSADDAARVARNRALATGEIMPARAS